MQSLYRVHIFETLMHKGVEGTTGFLALGLDLLCLLCIHVLHTYGQLEPYSAYEEFVRKNR